MRTEICLELLILFFRELEGNLRVIVLSEKRDQVTPDRRLAVLEQAGSANLQEHASLYLPVAHVY
jgi:hypothetical protein